MPGRRRLGLSRRSDPGNHGATQPFRRPAHASTHPSGGPDPGPRRIGGPGPDAAAGHSRLRARSGDGGPGHGPAGAAPGHRHPRPSRPVLCPQPGRRQCQRGRRGLRGPGGGGHARRSAGRRELCRRGRRRRAPPHRGGHGGGTGLPARGGAGPLSPPDRRPAPGGGRQRPADHPHTGGPGSLRRRGRTRHDRHGGGWRLPVRRPGGPARGPGPGRCADHHRGPLPPQRAGGQPDRAPPFQWPVPGGQVGGEGDGAAGPGGGHGPCGGARRAPGHGDHRRPALVLPHPHQDRGL